MDEISPRFSFKNKLPEINHNLTHYKIKSKQKKCLRVLVSVSLFKYIFPSYYLVPIQT
jgi:nitrate reductase cytochrome c-type subunit